MTDIRIRGARIHYRLDGPSDGPTLLLSNSLGTDLHMWDWQIPAFSSAFRVVRYDCRGHGRSGVPPAPYTIEDLGADALAVLDAVGAERAHLCGESLGGLVALWLAAHHPERVDRAVFASTAGRIGTPELWEARAQSVRDQGMEGVADTVIERFFSSGFRERHSEIVRPIRTTLLSTAAEGYIGCCMALRDADLREQVPKIRSPSLVVAGLHDLATPVSDAEWLHSKITRSELVVLEEAAHLCSIERPERFGEVVVRFLTD